MVNSICNRKILFKVLLYILLITGLVYTCFPMYWMIACSLKQNSQIFQLPPKFIFKPDFSAYINIFSNPKKIQFFGNSIVVSTVVTLMTLGISILAAYSFSRFNFIGKKFLNLLIISTQAVPPVVLIIPYFGLIVSLKLFDTYFALIFTYLIFTLPYAVLMMTGYFNTLPCALDEAVIIDGGSNRTILWKILVPISLPGIIATGIYTFLLSWNEYLFALTLTKTSTMRTVPVGIQMLMGQHSYEWSEMMAMSVLGFIPVIAIFFFAQKYFLAGMTSGAIKS